MSDLPSKMRALVFEQPGDVSALQLTEARAVPDLAAEGAPPADTAPVVVRVECAALNPVDAVVLTSGFAVQQWPAVLGVDFSGTVAQASAESKWKVGQKVWGFSGPAKPMGGTLAEYCAVPGSTLAAVPEHVSMQEASTLGCAGLAAAAGLWLNLGLEKDYDERHEEDPVLVYGASSCVGCFAVQLLKLAGYKVIAVASKKNHEYLQQLGAVQCYDYHDSDYQDQIAKDPGNHGMKAALDAIGMDTADQCFQIFEKCGLPAKQGMVATVRAKALHQKEELRNKPDSELSEVMELFNIYDGSRNYLADYTATLATYLAAGKLKPSNVTVYNGLESAKEALQLLIDHKVSLGKLVVCV